MPTNNFKAFAAGGGANVISQSAYEALTTLIANGFSSGTATSAQLNKVWRQSSIMSAVLAQYITDLTGEDAIDDGTTTTLLTNFKTAVQNAAASSTGGVYKLPCRVATTANVTTLAGGAPNAVDGVSLTVNDRILVKNQSTASENGIYYVTVVGSGSNGTWVRTTDADGVGELGAGAVFAVIEGTASAYSYWMLTVTGLVTIGTTALTFARKDAGAAPGIPVGFVCYFTNTTAPTGWIKANGAAISRSTYADLFAIIGTIYGAGNGTTTFNVPDLRGEFIRGLDEGRGADPDSGRAIGSLQAYAIQSHDHSYTAPTGAGYGQPAGGAGAATAATTGASGSAETRPRNMALLPCIKY